ncbi:tail tape measure protein, partial [Acinetobacter baumannii]|nr:tail tape measure protein [Acinetobacter baumannii]
LEKYLSERGLMNNDGTIKRSKEAVQAQFEFARSEMTNNKRWKKGFLDKKEISIDEARPELGGRGSYVGWARGQSTIRGEDGSRKPFDWQAQENKANQYSKIAERIS